MRGDRMKLERGQVAVVTGGASGIGLALATALARRGCDLVIADIEVDAMAAAAAELDGLGVSVLTHRTDVSRVEDLESLAAATMDRFGSVHVLCNNAGVSSRTDPWTGPLSSWDWVMGVNFWGVVHGIRAFLPHLVTSGGAHVVNTASIAGLYPGFGPAYDASKHGVVAVSESLFTAMAAAGVPLGVSCLCPGWVRTNLLDADRNWPDHLGGRPEHDPIAEVPGSFVRRAFDEATPPAVIADQVVAAVEENRFWVLPHQDFLDLAIERWHTIAERQNPSPPEQTPGLPPCSEIIAEVARLIASQQAQQTQQ
ncbi:MAG: SDR family NAD(P)-dependent oxidoreductase [Ilumatobacteraceae bacterium]